LFEEGFEGGEAAGDDACVAFDAVGSVNACFLEEKEDRGMGTYTTQMVRSV
jgi:hypothetical protein